MFRPRENPSGVNSNGLWLVDVLFLSFKVLLLSPQLWLSAVKKRNRYFRVSVLRIVSIPHDYHTIELPIPINYWLVFWKLQTAFFDLVVCCPHFTPSDDALENFILSNFQIVARIWMTNFYMDKEQFSWEYHQHQVCYVLLIFKEKCFQRRFLKVQWKLTSP